MNKKIQVLIYECKRGSTNLWKFQKKTRKKETEKGGDLWNQEIVGNSQLMLEMESRNSIYHEFWKHKILETF